MKEQSIKQYKETDIEKIITKLQKLGTDLKESIFCIQDSPIKDYLLSETSKIIEFRTAEDFYYLQSKITRMMNMVIRWELEGKILELLTEIAMWIQEIIKFVERKR
jgi:hypothetical protein